MGNSPFHDWPGFHLLPFLVLPIFTFLQNPSPLFRALFNAMVDYLALYPAIYIYGPMCNVMYIQTSSTVLSPTDEFTRILSSGMGLNHIFIALLHSFNASRRLSHVSCPRYLQLQNPG